MRSSGSRCAGSAVVAHGPSCSAARGILPNQGSNPCPLHWQADSQPLRHQGSPARMLFLLLPYVTNFCSFFISQFKSHFMRENFLYSQTRLASSSFLSSIVSKIVVKLPLLHSLQNCNCTCTPPCSPLPNSKLQRAVTMSVLLTPVAPGPSTVPGKD